MISNNPEEKKKWKLGNQQDPWAKSWKLTNEAIENKRQNIEHLNGIPRTDAESNKT